MIFNKFFNSTNENKTLQMCRFISLLIGIQGLIMTIINLNDNDLVQIITPLSYGLLMLFNFFYLVWTKKLSLFYCSASVIIFVLEFSFLKNGGTNGFGIIWLTIIPLFTVYLLNTPFFYLINAIFYTILIIALWSPLNKYFYDFNRTFEIRFPLVYGLTFLFASFLKYRITKTEKDLQIQKNLLSSEIHQAAVIQQTFYNQSKTEFSDWQIALKTIPMSEVTGDMYDIYSEDEKLHGLGLFDISGHGISSGLITMLTKHIIHQEFFSNLNNDLESTVYNIDSRITKEKGDIENYLTGILIKTYDDYVELVNAGHQFPIIYKSKDNSFSILPKDSSAIGAIGIKYLPGVFITQKIQVNSGDEIILYTDGLLEFKNKKNELFGIERFTNALTKVIDLNPERQVEFITNELTTFANQTKQTDDMTIIILKKI